MSSDRDIQRAAAFSGQLRQAHQHLRDWLGEIRAELGRDQRAEPVLPARCLAFCAALTRHHAGEDGGMFAELLKARPDLGPMIGKLLEDHGVINAILIQVRDLAARAAEVPGQEELPRLRRELDGLAAIAESHFGFEERALSVALDQGVPDTGWSRRVFRPGGAT